MVVFEKLIDSLIGPICFSDSTQANTIIFALVIMLYTKYHSWFLPIFHGVTAFVEWVL